MGSGKTINSVNIHCRFNAFFRGLVLVYWQSFSIWYHTSDSELQYTTSHIKWCIKQLRGWARSSITHVFCISSGSIPHDADSDIKSECCFHYSASFILLSSRPSILMFFQPNLFSVLYIISLQHYLSPSLQTSCSRPLVLIIMTYLTPILSGIYLHNIDGEHQAPFFLGSIAFLSCSLCVFLSLSHQFPQCVECHLRYYHCSIDQ